MLPNPLFHCSLILCFLSPNFAKIHLYSCLFLSNCSGHKLKYRELHLNAHLRENFCCKGDQTLAQVARRGCIISILADLQNMAGQGPGQSGPWFEQWVQTTSSGLFSPQLFCNWVNFSTEEDVVLLHLFLLHCSRDTSSNHLGT